MSILIDADGCPVVDITIKVSKKFNMNCTIICDTSHYFEREGAHTITVSKGADSVDFALVNMLSPDDIVVTQDYGLAAMCLARKAIPIRQDGLIYDSQNIDSLLNERHNSRKIRMAKGKLKGSKKRTEKEDKDFEESLYNLLEKLNKK